MPLTTRKYICEWTSLLRTELGWHPLPSRGNGSTCAHKSMGKASTEQQQRLRAITCLFAPRTSEVLFCRGTGFCGEGWAVTNHPHHLQCIAALLPFLGPRRLQQPLLLRGGGKGEALHLSPRRGSCYFRQGGNFSFLWAQTLKLSQQRVANPCQPLLRALSLRSSQSLRSSGAAVGAQRCPERSAAPRRWRCCSAHGRSRSGLSVQSVS